MLYGLLLRYMALHTLQMLMWEILETICDCSARGQVKQGGEEHLLNRICDMGEENK